MAIVRSLDGRILPDRIKSVLLIEDEPAKRASTCSRLISLCHIEKACTKTEALGLLDKKQFDCTLLRIRQPAHDDLALLRNLLSVAPNTPVVVMCSAADISAAVEAIRIGAADFIINEVESSNLVERIGRVIERQADTTKVEVCQSERLKAKAQVPGQMVVGKSEKMRAVMDNARRVAKYPVSVLLLGESGTGKELFARWIHRMSDRAVAPFVAVNLAAIPSDLIESTLFGHEKGAFTGAVGQRIGKFGLAKDGTLLLDEVGELKFEFQAKLLRVLQEGEYEQVGGDRTIQAGARIIAATNQNISAEVSQGTFRSDLYYRLKVVSITLPPLCERREDIPDLVAFFLAKYNRLFGSSVHEVSPHAMEAMMRHSWPGNIRELENMVQRATIIAEGECANTEDLFDQDLPDTGDLSRQVADRQGTLEDLEQQYITEVLRRTSGHQGQAAKILGIDRKTLYNKIMKYGLARSLNAKNGEVSMAGKSPTGEEKCQGA
jgi:DNA-binding NtrC family response regulator